MKPMTLVVIVLLGLLGPTAYAEVFKWTDEHGRVHYGDRPPGTKGQRLDIENNPAPPPETDRAERQRLQQRFLDAREQERAAKRQAKEKEKQAAARRARYCANARDRLRRYQRSNAVYKLDNQGERIYLSDQARLDAIEEARRQVAKWCQ